jgi:phosphatidylglycerol---prolipoprotein diacylglyceryl transferase
MTDMPMQLMALPFPTIDPVAIGIGPVEIRWYGLAYMAGLIIGWLYMRALARNGAIWGGRAPITPDQVDDFLIYAAIGTILGGRLGFVLFYEPSYFIANPLEVFALWGGGMAFHGGLLGVGLATYIFARRNNIPVFSVMDLAAAATPFGLFFGRMANFINGEIYGRLTDVPWAVEFPPEVLMDGHAFGPRHPTQLYEAILEGIVLFIALRYLTHRRGALLRPGIVVGAFLMIYGAVRIFAEFFKEQDYGQFFTNEYISSGMVYSLPMIALGLYFYLRAVNNDTDPLDRAGVHIGRSLESVVSFLARVISLIGAGIARLVEEARNFGSGIASALSVGNHPSGPTSRMTTPRFQQPMRAATDLTKSPREADDTHLRRVTIAQRARRGAAKLRRRVLLALLWVVNGLIGLFEKLRARLLALTDQPTQTRNLLTAPAETAEAEISGDASSIREDPVAPGTGTGAAREMAT